jgi:predicted helicase
MTEDTQINSIHDLLKQYREMTLNNYDMGKSFERLMKGYFETDPMYQSRYKTVALWDEWEHRWGPDCGIDIVCEGFDGSFTAVQCKFYPPEHEMQKKEIDSFFTESGRAFKVDGKKTVFTAKVIVCTSDRWSKNAEKSIESQAVATQRLRVQDLDSSPIDWSKFSLKKPEKVVLKAKKKLRPHQKEAIEKIVDGYKTHDRGKLIMACGTGKTFTALKLVETITESNSTILFLVPSISLLSQTLREWTAEAAEPFNAFAVCSDTKVGKHSEDISKHDLAIPATTDTLSLKKGYERLKANKRRTIVFSTYQSIDVVSKAQKDGIPDFDLVICDEAHRTTGVTLAGNEKSHFVKVHDSKFIKADKRIYMTATPRIYGDAAKSKADEAGAELCDMDDKATYGPEFHRLGFGKAVNEGLLTDYKVLVLAVDESVVDKKFQTQFANDDSEIPLEDIARIIGCWNGLSKRFVGEEAEVEDKTPMKRAVAFASTIKYSQQISSVFQAVVKEYISRNLDKSHDLLDCELQHVDGKTNVLERNSKLDWLKEEPDPNSCRILSNARCLSEGVDVPALDAVLFLNPRKSMVDIVQSVGRIMRKAEGKKYGYVILPIGVPAGMPPEEALKDNEKYKVVWQVLQALRAHDDRFNAEINQIELNKKQSQKIQVIGVGGGGEDGEGSSEPTSQQLSFPNIDEWRDAIYAKIVLKCGARLYWENWAKDVAEIAEKHYDRIKKNIDSGDKKIKEAFEKFHGGLKKNINPEITEDQAIEMLSQHLITKPVFDALFEHYPFTDKNPISKTMQSVVEAVEGRAFDEDKAKLKTFYDSVRLRVRGINNPEGRQKVIVELYDRFFKVAFPKMADRLGIVYTPVEVVDFIIKSVESVLQKEFGQSLGDKGVHILDPFTGTGTFVVRLLQSGILNKEQMVEKCKSELHANEIVLLAYYIATINIEEIYHGIMGSDYSPFDGVVLTDTFQMMEPEREDLVASLPENTRRFELQKSLPINVIISNPPYSAKQSSANDNNQNLSYEELDSRIRETYAKDSEYTNKTGIYDSYFRAFRWSTDRIADSGVIGFVTNGSFVDSTSADGLRKNLSKDFAKIYCLNLRGDARTQGEQRRKEGGNIFGVGTRTPVAITILVKKSSANQSSEIFYFSVADYLSYSEKIDFIKEHSSIELLPWETVVPNESGDWINQRGNSFINYIEIGNKKDKSNIRAFLNYTKGVQTGRDPWCTNFSASQLAENMTEMINNYNQEVDKLHSNNAELTFSEAKELVTKDSKKISWDEKLYKNAASRRKFSMDKDKIRTVLYRPFVKTNMYYDKTFNWSAYQIPKMKPECETPNLFIVTLGLGTKKDFTVLVTDVTPDIQLLGNCQCFPLYLYAESSTGNLTLGSDEQETRNSGISRDALNYFRDSLSDKNISDENVFYYIYGLMHSAEYRTEFQNDLKKMLPRLPISQNFFAFSSAGKELANLHLNYERVEPYELKEEISNSAPRDKMNVYRVTESGMKFPKEKKVEDRTKIIFNIHITLSGIPLEAYDYVVNGKSAIEWIMERYKVTVDLNKKGEGSGIKNDPNEWSDDPRYIIDLLKRVVTVSMETNRIVNSLPDLDIIEVDNN